jgi:hypothetical protein
MDRSDDHHLKKHFVKNSPTDAERRQLSLVYGHQAYRMHKGLGISDVYVFDDGLDYPHIDLSRIRRKKYSLKRYKMPQAYLDQLQATRYGKSLPKDSSTPPQGRTSYERMPKHY